MAPGQMNLRTLTLPAPAKLNLFLHITGRRADGYHRLQSIFQFLDHGDEIRLSLREDGEIRRVHELCGVPADHDLSIRAARLLQADTGTRLGADIEVRKKLPMGGGLGGGSSDAATVLAGLNHLWGLALSPERLAGLGLKLGADVPIFLYGHAAWAEGVGEKLEAVDPPEPWYVVINPGVQVSTAEVFNDPDLTRDCPPITIRRFPSRELQNVCEPVVRKRYPEVDKALNWLAEIGETAEQVRMTGTGGCVFASFEREARAREVLALVPDAWQAFVAKGMNVSPLLTALSQAAG